MAQQCTVILGDPQKLADELLALGEEVLEVEKTSSSGSFLVLSKTPATAQVFEVIAGDPDKLKTEINTLIGAGKTIDLIIKTFSASHYVVVYK